MKPVFQLGELAEATGTCLQGDAAKVIAAVASIEDATENEISFIRDRKYVQYLTASRAGALILTAELAADYPGDCLVSTNPYLTYAQIVTLLNPTRQPAPGISPSAVVAEDVILGADVHIGANTVLASGCEIGRGTVIGAGCVLAENCRVGEDGLLHPNVTLASETVVGDRVILHSGVVLGADGFGFVPQDNGWYKIPQIGRVVLGDDIEIGANTVLDRAAIGDTRLGNGVKLDNLIHIAHNVQIGDHTVIAACSGVAGSAKIGSRCQISGMCSIAGHLTIADGTTITATSLVINSITEPGVYSSGITVTDHASWRKNTVRFKQLDQLSRRVTALEKKLAAESQQSLE